MSSAASWSYTAKATLWPKLGRDDRTRRETFGPPEVFDCDYASDSKRMTNALGVEFLSKQKIYTERADVKQGDRVLIGESAATNPITAGAAEVQLVHQDADTFERQVDDFILYT